MIDYFAIGLTHLLLMIAAWRMLSRADLDRDDVAPGTPVHGPHHRLHARAAQLPAEGAPHLPAHGPTHGNGGAPHV